MDQNSYKTVRKNNIIASSKARFAMFGFCIVLILVSAAMSVYYVNSKNNLERQITQTLRSVAELKATQLISFIDAKKGRAFDFSSDGFIISNMEAVIHGESQSDIAIKLKEHLNNNKMTLDPRILAIDIVGNDGTVISSTIDKPPGRRATLFDEFQQLDHSKYGDVYFNGPHHSSLLNRIDIDFAVPVFLNRGEKPLGAIMIHYDPSDFNLIVSYSDGLKGSGEIYLVNENRLMLTESKYSHGTFMTQSIDTSRICRIRDDFSEKNLVYNNYMGVPVIGVAIDIPEYSWTLVVEVDKHDALVHIRKSGYFVLIVASVCIAIAIGIGIVLFVSTKNHNAVFDGKIIKHSDKDHVSLVKEKRRKSDPREINTFITKFPSYSIWIIITICVFPLILNLFGVDFSTTIIHPDIPALSEMKQYQVADSLHMTLSGSFTHTILEWSAFCIAIFTVLLAFVHFDINRDITTPIIGLVLFFAGITDAFHTLAADRLIEVVADNRNLIPFTWAICRLFNALIMIVWIGVFLILGSKTQKGGVWLVSITGVTLGVIAYFIIHICAVSEILPQTMFADSIISRPYDVAPLILFVFAGIFVYPRFYKQAPSLFSYSIILSMVPDVATQAYMAFGSTALFDNAFNIAHFLKIVAYLVPFIGLLLDYSITYNKEKENVVGLEKAMKELERFNRYAVGRELRMVELKQDINRLSVKLGEKPPYNISTIKNLNSFCTEMQHLRLFPIQASVFFF